MKIPVSGYILHLFSSSVGFCKCGCMRKIFVKTGCPVSFKVKGIDQECQIIIRNFFNNPILPFIKANFSLRVKPLIRASRFRADDLFKHRLEYNIFFAPKDFVKWPPRPLACSLKRRSKSSVMPVYRLPFPHLRI